MMSVREREALRHPRIEAFHKFFSEYHLFFAVEGDRFRVSLRVYETDDGRYFFEQSHFIRTPVQDEAHVIGAELHLGVDQALSRAVESVTTYYELAVERGHTPARDWFVRNDVY